MAIATTTGPRCAFALSAAMALTALHPGNALAQARLDAIEVRPIDSATGLPGVDIAVSKATSFNGQFDIDGRTFRADDLYVAVRLKAAQELADTRAKLELEVRDAATGRIVAGRTWTFLYVGPGGIAVKSLIASDATCKDLVFRARYGGKAIDARLDFKCGE